VFIVVYVVYVSCCKLLNCYSRVSPLYEYFWTLNIRHSRLILGDQMVPVTSEFSVVFGRNANFLRHFVIMVES